MILNQDAIDELISRRTESLNVEIKTWINPQEPEGKAKIVIAAFALRNRNGGYLLIGFNDDTLAPDQRNEQINIRETFHIDKIQSIITNFASEPFEISIAFGILHGKEYPVLVIPTGVQTPVAAKRDLLSNNNKPLIREGAIYFRTLLANGTPSSATAKPNDWNDLVSICFDNREADIGRFLRRHLANVDIHNLAQALTTINNAPNSPTLKEKALELLDEGEQRFEKQVSFRQLSDEEQSFLNLASSNVALIIYPNRTKAIPDHNFLNAVASSNPRYTGWPAWLDSRGFRDHESEPIVIDSGWQALIISAGGTHKHCDFMRFDPKGEFYQKRILEDDVSDRVEAGNFLDPILVIIRVAEIIAVGLSLANSLGYPDDSRLGFAFRWTGLQGRQIKSWVSVRYYFPTSTISHENTINTSIELSIDTPISAIAPYVEEATRALFLSFGGYSISSNVIEEHTKRLIERRLLD